MNHVDRSPPVMTPAKGAEGRALNRDFEVLYAAHFDHLTLQLYAYTSDLGLAQDVVQEAFCRALLRWNRLVGYDDPVAWVRRVAWNLATNRFHQLRHYRLFLRRQREEQVPAPNPDHVVLTTALAKLPANQRQAVVMHYLADLSVAEIAEQTGVAQGTVKSWLHRGRMKLAATMTAQGEGSVHADHG